jgi:hypothetical protein
MNKAKCLSIIRKNNYTNMQTWNLLVEEAGAMPFYDATTDTEDFRLPNGDIVSINMATREVS